MDNQSFKDIYTDQIDRCNEILANKAKEYASDVDRLHNFKVMAALRGCAVRDAVAGVMAKHTVSIYDMCRSSDTYSAEAWNEKITDHLNYLFLLQAVLHEEALEESLKAMEKGETELTYKTKYDNKFVERQ